MLEALRRLYRGVDLDADPPVLNLTLEALRAHGLVYLGPMGYRAHAMLTPHGVSMVLETSRVRLQPWYLDGFATYSTFGEHFLVDDAIAWRAFCERWKRYTRESRINQ